MVLAEMVMGRFGYGPIWLWAEMTSDRINFFFSMIYNIAYRLLYQLEANICPKKHYLVLLYCNI